MALQMLSEKHPVKGAWAVQVFCIPIGIAGRTSLFIGRGPARSRGHGNYPRYGRYRRGVQEGRSAYPEGCFETAGRVSQS